VSLTALEISFDNPILHRNLSGSFEHEDEGYMLIPADQECLKADSPDTLVGIGGYLSYGDLRRFETEENPYAEAFTHSIR
jgi:hypothetical protein